MGPSHGRLAGDDRRPDADPRGRPPRRGRPGRRADAPTAQPRRIRRPARGQGQPVGPARGGAGQGRGGRSRPPLRPARARQDDPRDDHRPRARRQRPLHVRAGDRAGRGPGRDPDRARRARRPVHRRDPPAQPGGRGDPLPGDGGLRPRRDDRQGALGAVAPADPQAVHDRRRDDPGGTHLEPAPRPLRGDLPARLLRRGRPRGDRRALGRDPRRRADPRRGRGDRPARPGHAADRQPAPQARPRPRPGPRRRAGRRGRRRRGDPGDGDRRRRARLDRSQAPGRDRPEVRQRTGRGGRARGGPGRGGRDDRGRLRAVPAPDRVPRPDAAGPDRDRRRPGPPRRLGYEVPPRRSRRRTCRRCGMAPSSRAWRSRRDGGCRPPGPPASRSSRRRRPTARRAPGSAG